MVEPASRAPDHHDPIQSGPSEHQVHRQFEVSCVLVYRVSDEAFVVDIRQGGR